MSMNKAVLMVVLVGALFSLAPARAGVTYSFTHIVQDGDGAAELANGAIGEAQLFVEVSDYDILGVSHVLFTFTNTGPEASSITDIYFEDGDGTLLGIAVILDADENGGIYEGVYFTENSEETVHPGVLPGGELIGFEPTVEFSVDSDAPIVPNGINPGETLGIVFRIQRNAESDAVTDLDTGDLRIAIHVQGFSGGGSEAFVNNGRTPTIPVPGAFALCGIGICSLGWMRKLRVL